MSTQINVTVERGDLVERAKAEQQKNRRQKLEADNRKKVEAKAKEEREKQEPLKPVPPLPIQLRRDELAAQRQGGAAGMSIGWVLNRIKEPPLLFSSNSTTSVCGGPYLDFKNYSKVINKYKVFSGSGAASTEFDAGFDYSNLWTPASAGPDMSAGLFPGTGTLVWSGQPPRRISVGEYNPAFPGLLFPDNGTSRTINWEIWLPVSKGVILYYFYYKIQTAFQFAATQLWVICPGSSADFSSLYGIQPPTLYENTTERCLLVSADSIKSLTPPAALRSKLLSANTSYTLVPQTRTLTDQVIDGQYVTGTPYVFTGYRWSETPPTTSMNALLGTKGQNYSASGLPGSSDPGSFSSGYYITTGAVYKGLVADPSTDYNRYQQKAPTITPNTGDATGFGAGSSWPDIYDNATILKHTSSANSIRVLDLAMSENRIEMPTDSVTYTTPEGFEVTSNWNTRVAIGYDWANAVYCRQQLLSLGFTPADLTP